MAVLRAARDTGDPEGVLAQRLYPVLDDTGAPAGVVTRTTLLRHHPDDSAPLADLATPAITVRPDQTLRHAAAVMAGERVTRLLVVDPARSGTVTGVLTLRDLLHARRVDLHEEHHAQRVLTIRLRRVPRTVLPAAGTPPDPAPEEPDPLDRVM